MNYKKAATRLERYLSNELGWETRESRRDCKGCEAVDYQLDHKFCAQCGTKLPRPKPTADAVHELESALRYALNTDKQP